MKTDLFSKSLIPIAKALLGVFFYAFAYRVFLLPFHLYNGGFTGIAQILQSLSRKFFFSELHTDISGIILWCLNLPLFFLVYKTISKNFLLKTIITVFFQSFFMILIPIPQSPLITDCLTSCLIGGAISGLAAGLALSSGSCGGGSDIIGLYCAMRYPRFSVGKLNLLLNFVIYLYSAMEYEFTTAIYSFIFSASASFFMDRIHHQNIKTNVMIISECPSLGTDILQVLHRGYTYWYGFGGYTKKQIYIYLTVISKSETGKLKRIISEKDPHAFVTFSEHLEVLGNFEKRFDI